jgi:hypothetical protein
MSIDQKSLGYSMAGLILVLGCGGRSDMTVDQMEVGGHGGARGGTTWTTLVGGTPAMGGYPGQGGWATAAGGFTVQPQQRCCQSYAYASCDDAIIVNCVCSQMPDCCTSSWSTTCVWAITKFNCAATGYCGFGGTTSNGGTTSKGGTTVKGGTTSRGGTAGMGGTTVKGGTTSNGGTTSKGGTSTYYGGTTSRGGTTGIGGTAGMGGTTGRGGTTAKEACCLAHPSLGCNDEKIEKCVCATDATCCRVGWDNTCVSDVNSFGCGFCAAGGTTSMGGSGGATSKGGTTSATGGAPPNGGTVSTGGTIVTTDGGSGGTIVTTDGGTTATGGTTDVGSGGTIVTTDGGTTATGGTTDVGSGGTTATGGTTTTTAVPLNVIDDLEDGDGNIYPIDGRLGYWHTFNDGSSAGEQKPEWGSRIFIAEPITDRSGSNYAAWTAGHGFTNWGAGIAVYVTDRAAYYDASKYQGITFWAKVDPESTNQVRFDITDVQTESDGGYCKSCWNYFGRTISLSTKWQRYGFVWGDLVQQSGWGDQFVKIIPSAIREIRFSTTATITFSIYIDDVAFIP